MFVYCIILLVIQISLLISLTWSPKIEIGDITDLYQFCVAYRTN